MLGKFDCQNRTAYLSATGIPLRECAIPVPLLV